MYFCPLCENKIEELNYNASTRGYENGSAILSKIKEENSYIIVDWDYCNSSTEETDVYEYNCPECDGEIRLSNIIWKDDKEEKEIIDEPEETKHKIITPKNNIISAQKPTDISESGMICKKCNYLFVYKKYQYDGKNEFCECPKCGTNNSINAYFKKFNNTT